MPRRLAISVAGLTLAVALRWEETVRGAAGAVTIGVVFGLGLLVVAGAAGWRPLALRRSAAAVAVAVGAAGGSILVVLALVARSGGISVVAPATTFVPWMAATVLVASAEEILLRGALFDALDRTLGTYATVLITALAFALMHVPLYGWQVVPLDLGVGLWLAGLRLATGGIVAPAIAHTIADLATWWL